MRKLLPRFAAILLAFAVALPGWAQSGAPTFSKERLDQLLAPIALYPDSLLTQVRKNLRPGGDALAHGMQRFDPGPGWEAVQVPSQVVAKGATK